MVPDGLTVPVKRGLGQHTAEALHPQEAQERLRQGASQAVRQHDDQPPISVPRSLDIEVDLYQPRSADIAALGPSLARTGRTVAFHAENMAFAYGVLQLLALLTYISP